MDQTLVRHDRLREIAVRVLVAAGAAAPDAEVVAEHLVDANLAGHDSHGIGMLPQYVRAIAKGLLDPRAHAAFEDAGGPILAVDGRRGFGMVVGREGIGAGMARAATLGLAAVALRNAFHVSRVGAYAEQAARGGLVSVHFVNVVGHAPLVAPFRGADARLMTNPFCVGVPGPGGAAAVLLDFATSRVALGKVREARARGDRVPEGCIIDAQGRATTDPAALLDPPKGALLPFGEHKGSGLALVCELLAGALTGGGILSRVPYQELKIGNNMLSILLDPARFPGGAGLARDVADTTEWLKAAPPADPSLPVLVAGEPEAASRAARLALGIPVAAGTWEDLVSQAGKLGVVVE
ncbi:MAG TPA: malate/lactate/ureidoglycolate dehydrogenase [Anaeromyxobacter sp.]